MRRRGHAILQSGSVFFLGRDNRRHLGRARNILGHARATGSRVVTVVAHGTAIFVGVRRQQEEEADEQRERHAVARREDCDGLHGSAVL